MDFAALPPEINSGRIYTGPGQAPLLVAANAWGQLSEELRFAANGIELQVSALVTGFWRGQAAVSMASTVSAYITWLHLTASHAEQAAAGARAAAAAFATAFTATVPPPIIAANRQELALLVASNVLGQNAAAIAAAEAQYAQMWVQDAVAMYDYAAASAQATRLSPFTAPPTDAHFRSSVGQHGGAHLSGPAVWANRLASASLLTAAIPHALQTMAVPSISTPVATTSTSAISTILQTLGITPLNLLSPANTAMSTTSLANAYMASDESQRARVAILAVGQQISGTEDEILGRINRLDPMVRLALAHSSSNLVSATTADMGHQAALVGKLSVPPSWTTNALGVRSGGLSLPALSLRAVEDTLGSGSDTTNLFNQLSLAGAASAGYKAGLSTNTSRMSPASKLITTEPQSAHPPRATSPQSLAAELYGLAQLREAGIVSEGEFNLQKQRLLGT